MSLPKRYRPKETEPRLSTFWRAAGIYHFSAGQSGPVYSIDTPPATVSGKLHLGHAYSYSHPDFIARFQRMRGLNIYYPMGFDDNGLPTERLVEKRLGTKASQLGRTIFIEKCLEVSLEAEADYQDLWQRLGLSVDWRYTYRTIDERSRRTSQHSFIELYQKGLAYRRESPAIWCPECQTAIAQADLEDLERTSEFVTLAFRQEDGEITPIATTRPELLPACVAVFVHPEDERYRRLIGHKLQVPLFGQSVPVLSDPDADPDKGTGAVMCCTFGDTGDVAWWRKHKLPLVEAIDRQGIMTAAAGVFSGLPLDQARRQIKDHLAEQGILLARQNTEQSVRIHERCRTPVEYINAPQWFIRLLEFKEELLQAGQQVNWHPAHMHSRYRAWVENLHWDWCISRQRYYGVPFPVWYCQECGKILLAELDELPIDPSESAPSRPCRCGSTSFTPETDIMDTWATSSMTPQIVGQWLPGSDGLIEGLYERVFPYTLRAQAHEIIRTWAFYTIAKSHFHFNELPWQNILISGWGIAGEGKGKISKSRGGGASPLAMIERYSADAVRYWAASTGPGKDAIISEDKMQIGARLVTKLWNVARFSQRFLAGYRPPDDPTPIMAQLTPADHWILASIKKLIQRATSLLKNYEYAAAKSEIETFFWRDMADNYLEMAKQRLYDPEHPQHQAARFALYLSLLDTLKLFAPYLPFVTEEIYRGVFAAEDESASIHRCAWPTAHPDPQDNSALELGNTLVEIATAVRRYKSEQNLPLGSELTRLQLGTASPEVGRQLKLAAVDLRSITRSTEVEIVGQLTQGLIKLQLNGDIMAAIEP